MYIHHFCDTRAKELFVICLKVTWVCFVYSTTGHSLNYFPIHWSFSAGTNYNSLFSLLGKGRCILAVALVPGGGNLCVLAPSGYSKSLHGCNRRDHAFEHKLLLLGLQPTIPLGYSFLSSHPCLTSFNFVLCVQIIVKGYTLLLKSSYTIRIPCCI